MKLLFLAPYIYATAYEEHSKNKTGFGFMVYDIASGAGKSGNQVVLMAHAFGPKRNCEGFRIAENTLWKNILYGHYRGLARFCLRLKKTGVPLAGVVKGAYYYLHIGYIRHFIKKEKPDVVHIHGCGVETAETLDMLCGLGVPHVVTLHGLLQNDISASQYLKNCEHELLRRGNTPITVISSKMRERLSYDYYGVTDTKNVRVITNGVDVDRQDATCDVREKHGIPAEKKIILSVGSVCELKNQNQTAQGFASLPKELQDQYVLLFAGDIHENDPTLQKIEALQLGDRVLFAGFVPREELCNYYRAADLTVTASVTEGFGLPIIEGFVYGTPGIAFSDLDAIGDIYDECAMLLCRIRSDQALAETISNALSKSWDKDRIIAHSKKFSLAVMSQKYQEVYEALL